MFSFPQFLSKSALRSQERKRNMCARGREGMRMIVRREDKREMKRKNKLHDNLRK